MKARDSRTEWLLQRVEKIWNEEEREIFFARFGIERASVESMRCSVSELQRPSEK